MLLRLSMILVHLRILGQTDQSVASPRWRKEPDQRDRLWHHQDSGSQKSPLILQLLHSQQSLVHFVLLLL